MQDKLKTALDVVFARKKWGDGEEAIEAARRRKLRSLPSDVVSVASHAMEQEKSDDDGLQGRSLYLFGPTNRFRRGLAAVIWHPRFEQVVIVLICLSSITLALDSPRLDPSGKFKRILVRLPSFGVQRGYAHATHLRAPYSSQLLLHFRLLSEQQPHSKCTGTYVDGFLADFPAYLLAQTDLDFSFVVIFAVEAAMKIVVYGLIMPPNSYLKSAWNVLDFLTVVVGVVLLTVRDINSQFTSLRSLRTLRALRPIRMASRAPGMKVRSSQRTRMRHCVAASPMQAQRCVTLQSASMQQNAQQSGV